MKSVKHIQTTIVVLVAIVVVVGVYMAGSPNQARQERIDSERSNRLSALSNDIGNYYRAHDALPDTLQSLEAKDESRYKDPETNEWFVYEQTANNAFDLCATFATRHEEPYYGPNVRYIPAPNSEYQPLFVEEASPYSHGVGYECFSYALSSDL